MRRMTIFSGIVIGFFLALLSLLLQPLLSDFLPTRTVFELALVFAQCVYFMYLVLKIRVRSGALSLAVLNAILAIALCWLPLSRGWFLLLWGLTFSVNRSLILHRTWNAVGKDLAISLLGTLFFSHTLVYTQSLPLALWSFFLLQSLSAAIPSKSKVPHPADSCSDPFQQAQRQAEDLLENLQQRPFSWFQR